MTNPNRRKNRLAGITARPLKKKIAAVAIIAVAAVAVWFYHKASHSRLQLENDQTIDITPEQVESILEIGEWEFLSIADEEMVDTIRRGIFTDDHLSRIYYGTLRLGVNLKQMDDGWMNTRKDTLFITLPPIGLLDQDFIDEARTKSFYESGRWTADDREALYERARQKMLRHALTPQNLQTARQNGEAQVRQVLGSMGFATVDIDFQEPTSAAR